MENHHVPTFAVWVRANLTPHTPHHLNHFSHSNHGNVSHRVCGELNVQSDSEPDSYDRSNSTCGGSVADPM